MRQTAVVNTINNNNMCSSNPASRFSETMLATIGPIGRTLISAMDLKLRCSANGCECANFIAAKDRLRSCDGCKHSWITHLFEKLLRDETLSIFDVCSLALYGTHALPIRLKIVIERLLGTLQPEEIDKILRSFGWTPPDLARGYMIQEPRGGLLTRWSMLPREEEILILQQFLRFSPTRSLSFSLLKDDFQFNISQQQQLQLHQHQQQQQLQLLPSPPSIPPVQTTLLENITPTLPKIKTENSVLNLSSSVHSRSRSTSSHPITPTSISPPNLQQQPHHHHHHVHPHRHHQHHNHFNHGQHRSRTTSTDDDQDEPAGGANEQHGEMNNDIVDLSFSSNAKNNNNNNNNSTSNISTMITAGNHFPFGKHNTSTTNAKFHNHHNNGNNHNISSESINKSNNNNSNNVSGRKTPSDEQQHVPQQQLHHHHHHREGEREHGRKHSSREHERRTPNEKPSAPKSESGGRESRDVTDSAHLLHHHRQQHWSPLTANPSQLVNPATGKRRVQCSVCLKTFCDKGALKIHFSAVHLREMHKCTVSGCNMMFSSRRSRNRHSANPNPKLHSPHLRRRISPHDGRSSNPMIPLVPGLLGPMLPGSGFTNGLKMDDMGHMDEMDSYLSPSSSLSSLTSEKSPPEPEESSGRRDGARKRKLSNPVRLPSVPDDSNDDFCCYDDGTEVVPGDSEDPEDEKNHLERLESLPIFSNHSDSPGSHDDEFADGGSPNSTNGSDSIPLDKENPRRCITCGKEFQNHFGVKTHYQNVHLKLMHKCTVDGCNAAFPSKRSRDRHAANLNLHRKLLSTSDASNGSTADEQPLNQLQLNLSNTQNSAHHQLFQHQPHLFSPRHSFSPFLLNGVNASPSALNQVTPPWNPFLSFPVFPNVFTASTPPASLLSSTTHLSQISTSSSASSSSSPPHQTTTSSTSPKTISTTDPRFCTTTTTPTLGQLQEAVAADLKPLRCRKCNLVFFSRTMLDSHSCNNIVSNGI